MLTVTLHFLLIVLCVVISVGALSVAGETAVPYCTSAIIVTSGGLGFVAVVSDSDNMGWLRPFDPLTMELAHVSANISLAPPGETLNSNSILNIDAMVEYQGALIVLVSGEVLLDSGDSGVWNVLYLLSFSLPEMKVIQYRNLSEEVVPNPSWNGAAPAVAVDATNGVLWIGGIIMHYYSGDTATSSSIQILSYLLKTALDTFETEVVRTWDITKGADPDLQFNSALFIPPSSLLLSVAGGILSFDTATNASFVVSTTTGPNQFQGPTVIALVNSSTLFVVQPAYVGISAALFDPVSLKPLHHWQSFDGSVCGVPNSAVAQPGYVYLACRVGNYGSVAQFQLAPTMGVVDQAFSNFTLDSTVVSMYDSYSFYSCDLIKGGVTKFDLPATKKYYQGENKR